MDLNGKTIVITGAARGLGAAMARRLARHKPKLALVDMKQDDLAAITAAICAGPRRRLLQRNARRRC